MSLSDFGVLIATIIALSTFVAGIVVFLVRYALIPFLERRWSKPIEEMIGDIREMKAEVVVISRAFDGHLDWSQREVDQIWSAINRRKTNEKSNPRRPNARDTSPD